MARQNLTTKFSFIPSMNNVFKIGGYIIDKTSANGNYEDASSLGFSGKTKVPIKKQAGAPANMAHIAYWKPGDYVSVHNSTGNTTIPLDDGAIDTRYYKVLHIKTIDADYASLVIDRTHTEGTVSTNVTTSSDNAVKIYQIYNKTDDKWGNVHEKWNDSNDNKRFWYVDNYHNTHTDGVKFGGDNFTPDTDDISEMTISTISATGFTAEAI